MRHADLAFNRGDAVLSGFLGVPERGDCATEQDQRPGDIAPRGLETPLVPVPCPAEQGAYVFLEHGERRVGQPGLEARRLDNEDRRSPCGFEIGDVRDSHDRPFVDQPVEASRVDASGARGIDSQPSGIFEAIQQRDDVGGRGRLRIIPQPGEAGSAQFRIDREQPRERVPLGVGQSGRERLEGFLSRASTRGQPDPFEHRRRRQHDAAYSQMSEHCLDDGFATIRGPRRVRAYPKAGAPVHQSETPQAQISLQFDGMFAAGLIPLRIVGEVDVPHAELTGYEGNHGLRRLLGRSHAEARVP